MLALFAVAALMAPPGGSPVVAAPTVSVAPLTQAPLRITLNNGGDFTPGDRVRVQVESAEDGFLIVFRVDGDGRVRVIFPIDPDLDPFIRGGRRYELRGRAERETFLADDRSGNGLIYAALSQEPYDFRRYASGDHWDYANLRLSAWDADAEPELTEFVKRMAGSGRFTYDVLGYRVHGDAYISGGGGIVSPAMYGSPFYDPYWSCLACGYGVRRSGVNIRVGIGGGWDYDPWGRYDPWYYDPYRYGYGYGYGYGGYWDPWDWRYPGQYRPITVINLPRPQIPNTAYGYRARPRTPVAGGLAPDLTRVVRGDTRPSAPTPANNGRARGREDQPTRATPRPSEPQRQDRGQAGSGSPPDRGTSRPSNPPASSPPPSSPPASSGGTRARPRPGGGDELVTAPTQSVAPQMDRRGEERPVVAPVVEQSRRASEEPTPVFREPFRARPEAAPSRAEPQRAEPSRSQPVYREPPRAEPQRVERQAPPQRAEPQRSEPQRVERQAPPRSEPVSRAAPPSSPPPAAPPASTSGRSRPRP